MNRALLAELRQLPPLELAPAPVALTPAGSVGLLAWSTTIRDADGFPVGGLVVDTFTTPDPETGEVRRSYLMVDPHDTRPRIVWHVLAESDVDASTVERAGAHTVGLVILRLCEEVALANPHTLRKPPVRFEHVELIAHAKRLGGVL